MAFDRNEFKKAIKSKAGTAQLFHLPSLDKLGIGDVARLPYSIRVLLESAVRNLDGFRITEEDVRKILNWQSDAGSKEVAFKPARVVLQDFTGVPAIVV